ncbi:hypothetical protein PLESTM_002008700 [Pleodorina starrii]|nr:hypothetical protein PLESTM_002008700 [Pleodorina starrii]
MQVWTDVPLCSACLAPGLVIDSLFVCFAMDRDIGQVSSLDVHTVMSKLATVGAVVQQPDGGLVYDVAAVYDVEAAGLQLGLVGLLELPLLMAAIAAAMNGTRVYNTDRVDHGSATAAEQCLDADGGQVPCCEWQTEPWVPAYLAFAFVAMTWSLFLAFQIKMFTVAGATAQWYFQSASASAASGSGGGGTGRYRSRTLTSLRFAVGPSLGSLSGQCGTDTGIYGPSGAWVTYPPRRARKGKDGLAGRRSGKQGKRKAWALGLGLRSGYWAVRLGG